MPFVLAYVFQIRIMRGAMASIEEKVEYHFKRTLDTLGVEHYAKTQSVNSFIEEALSQYESKSGGEGNNYPDIKCLLDDGKGRCIPVMMEAKGDKKKLEKTDSNNAITEYTKDGTPDYKAIQGYAVNGALHYGRAILKHPHARVSQTAVPGDDILRVLAPPTWR